MRQMTPSQTYAFLQSNDQAVLIDCRTEMEYMYVGHPLGAIHVAWAEYPEFIPDPQAFAQQVLREVVQLSRPVALICRSGTRTVAAGQALVQAGFTDVINVLHGFEGELDVNMHRNTQSGWRFEGLPWEQM